MAKITDVVGRHDGSGIFWLGLPERHHKLLRHVCTHSDEVYTFDDAEELGILLDIPPHYVAWLLWVLVERGYLTQMRFGNRIYCGSRDAIDAFQQAILQG